MLKNKKLICILLVAIFSLTAALTGCGGSGSEGTTANSGSNATGDAAGGKEPLKITATLRSVGGKMEESKVHQEWLKQMEAKMGRKLDITFNYVPSAEYDEKVKLLLTSGEVSDIMALPFFYNYLPLAKQGVFLDLSKYESVMPNYMKRVEQAHDGKIKAYTDDGKMVITYECFLPRLPADKGIVAADLSSYRYDLFEANNIKIPETLDELYDAAKKLKELFPDKYPINTRWAKLDNIFFAHHVKNDVYWNGTEYVSGVNQDGYKEALQFINKLYTEKLLDPEYSIETDDTVRQKALNGENFIWLSQWFTTPGEYTRTATDGKIFAVALPPSNPKYGKVWIQPDRCNEIDLSGWGTFAYSATTKEPEELAKLVDLQYSDETIRLITWGIEGESYTLGADGQPVWVDSIKNAADPWLEGDKYGSRSSKNYRPGFQMGSDSRAFMELAPIDHVFYKGEYKQIPVETAFMDISYPDNEYSAPWFNEPILTHTEEENQEVTTNITPINTYRDEMQVKFIMGKQSFEKWDNFMNKLKTMGDMDKIIKIKNDTAKRYFDRKAELGIK